MSEEKTNKKKRKWTSRNDEGLTGWLIIDLVFEGIFWILRGLGKAIEAILEAIFD